VAIKSLFIPHHRDHEMPIPLASQSDIPCVLRNDVGEAAPSTQPVSLHITVNITPPNLPKSTPNIPTERVGSPAEGTHSIPSRRTSLTPAASPSCSKVVSRGTRIRAGLWHSRQTASTSSQVQMIEQSVCRMPRRERQWQALSLDTQIQPGLWHSRQMASTSS